jgi:hypothetical protein
MQVQELVKYYILEFELRLVRLRIIFIRKNIEANPYCSRKLVETSEHFLLKCSLYERLRNDLFVNQNNVMKLTETLLLIFAGSSFQSRMVEGKKLLS